MPFDDTPATLKDKLIEFKRTVAKQYSWSLHDIDETDACNLISFVTYIPIKDSNIREIDGKTYIKTTKPPSWL